MKHEDGYTVEEVKEHLKEKGYSWTKFLEFMRGQTVGVVEGKELYWNYDVERYHEGMRTRRVKE